MNFLTLRLGLEEHSERIYLNGSLMELLHLPRNLFSLSISRAKAARDREKKNEGKSSKLKFNLLCI